MNKITNETMTVDQALRILAGDDAPKGDYVLVLPARYVGGRGICERVDAIDIARWVVTESVIAECKTDTDNIDTWIANGDYSEAYDVSPEERIAEIAAEWDELHAE